jgi:tetratricopeptide (TPR) repeat protein
MNRGVTLHRLGRYDDALKNHERVLALDPDNAVALANRGVTLQNLERHQDALASFEKSLAVFPENADVWSNHGNTLHNLKRHDQALASFDRALGLRPDHAQSWNNRGMVLQALGKLDDALESFDKAVAANPDYAEAWNSRAIVLTDLGRVDEALESIARVQAINPAHEGALRNTGLALFEGHRIAEGLAAFADLARLSYEAVAESEDETAPHRIRHDDEQRAYLKKSGGDPSIVNRVLHWQDGEKIAGPAINTADVKSVSEKWRNAKPQIVVIDNFLTAEALAQLRKFCLGSSIWRHTYEDGYLGALPEQGFAAPLLAQIADEMRLAYPDIFQAHALRYLWAFKYDSALSGTAIHADQAAVNVNFWITPDEANKDANSGGLIVWDKTAPLDWDFERFNCDEKAQRDFLASTGAKPIVIPHRANRAVVFDSDLFHETDKIAFKDGYENRRINVTLLYGRRNA